MKQITYGDVCTGLSAASVAWGPLGWKAAWFAEIEPFPCAALAHHYPTVPNFGDMTKLANYVRSKYIAAPDVLVGGTPCQAFSVAGARAGLADPRGQLTLSFADLADAIDERRISNNEPECIIYWENVPGVLSDKTNAFGCLLAVLAGEDDALVAPGGEMAERWCCYWTPKGNRLAYHRCSIFWSGPTTPPSVPCRKCSSGVRSR